MTRIMKYCPWCDYQDTSLSTLLKHYADEHPFLAGIRPPEDDSYTIRTRYRIGANDEMEDLLMCKCGHAAEDHNGPIGDCQGRCLCELCPDDTGNDCWCAGFKAT